MKIFITGISGFIGRHLSKKLLKDNHQLYAVIRKPVLKNELERNNITCFIDNNSTVELIDFFNREKFDGVIHLASYFVVEHKPEEIHDLINSNILFATRVLEAAARSRVPWFINTGTFWQHYENREYSPINLYAATKQAFEAIARFYIEVYGISFVTLKLIDTYGPEDKRPKILNLWNRISSAGGKLDMSGGEQVIDMVYIDDVVEAYAKLMELLRENPNLYTGRSFTVSSGRCIKLKELAQIYTKITGRKLNINWGGRPYRTREVMQPWDKGESVPGWAPKISLEEGIRKMLVEHEKLKDYGM